MANINKTTNSSDYNIKPGDLQLVDATGLEDGLYEMSTELKAVQQYVINMQKHGSGAASGLFSHKAATETSEDEISEVVRDTHVLMEKLRNVRDVTSSQPPELSHD
tara:strand:+ start:837 stop:1154 length:318 start_codon:yes stop_codon:yes gene_type:complete